MKTDNQIQQDVINELRWDASITAKDFSVSVCEGIVSLRGSVPHFVEKVMAEDAILRVGGVRAIVDEVEVHMVESATRTDAEIADAALNALKWNYFAPKDIHVTVEKGQITISGQTEWDFQRIAAKRIVSSLMGVIGVTSKIRIKTKSHPVDIKTGIEEALKRLAARECDKIHVAVTGGHVTLSGKVQSFIEIQESRRTAWNAPGVMMVESNVKVA